MKTAISLLIFCCLFHSGLYSESEGVRKTESFNDSWRFMLGDYQGAKNIVFDDSKWRVLNLPHDWSIEGEFSQTNPATPDGGALPGGIGWYRKSFFVPITDKEKEIYSDFDGVYRNSEVWINGHYLGMRPYGYSSFQYDLTPYLKYGNEKNVISVKVDNSRQPNSRWYSGSGIYRNVWLVTTNKIHVEHWGTFITTPEANDKSAKISLEIKIRNSYPADKKVLVRTKIISSDGFLVKECTSESECPGNNIAAITQEFNIINPILWSVDKPDLYRAVTTIEADKKIYDDYVTVFGIRTFEFDASKGFILNGKPVKIKGVCNHHDLGCLGSAVNRRAIERQLEILKSFGCNGIRTSHNPPAPELLELCDKMGFIVMDEAFDMWKIKKTDFDYSLDWDAWHKRDLQDLILRDRNHPSVFMWSIGNEIPEQWDSSGILIGKELADIVKQLDTTRPITSACNNPKPENFLVRSGALDLIGLNYSHKQFPEVQNKYPGQKFIASETTSALATRGYYDMPSDTIRIWPDRWDGNFKGNPDNTCSAYDNCRVPWGSTHEESWSIVKKLDFISGMFIWTGFDYLGEPTPYSWPSRSSYFGIVDLAGFPKDAYYLYQSEWTDKDVLHLLPHWNWKEGDTIDVWAFTNCSEVELFLNNKSFGSLKKTDDNLHLKWQVPFTQGTLKAVGKKDSRIISDEIHTAGNPSRIILEADRNIISADGNDLSFITVRIVDDKGITVPYADNLVKFEVSGKGKLVGVDNGLQTSHESFKADYRKAFNGLCLAVVQSETEAGAIILKAKSDGLQESALTIQSNKK